MSKSSPTPSTPAALWGAQAIGEFVGLNTRATFHLMKKGALPARRVGGRWCALPSELLAALKPDKPE